MRPASDAHKLSCSSTSNRFTLRETGLCDSPRASASSCFANTNATFNIWVMNADGSGATPLTRLTASGAHSTAPSFSPDGSRIVFQSKGGLNGTNAANTTMNIWTINPDGSGGIPVTQLTAVGADIAGRPSWSFDGGRIAFESRRALDGTDAANANLTSNIWTVHADGSNPAPVTQLASSGAHSFSAQWSPDGTKLIFVSRRRLDGSDAIATTPNNIWMVKADGSGATHLTSLANAGNESPDIP